jgi:hypothetical protein
VTNTHGQGPKYFVDVEGTDYEWDSATITVPQIRELGNIPAGTEILEINLKTNEEKPLAEDVVVALVPGHGFSKKITFKRG